MQTRRLRIVAAVLLAAIAFSLYFTTLLPGQDLGDTASFQAVAGRSDITPRQGYPLYFFVLDVLVHAVPGNPAFASNLASAVAGALAVGLIVLVGAEVAGGALAGGLAAAALYATSYTFWSQAIIAEVYALHLLCSNAALLSLLWWYRQPSDRRLALFFALFALGFGNHLSMVLQLPGFALFLLVASPGGPGRMLRPKVVAMAVGLAALFSLQYAWNFASMLAEPRHPGLPGLLANFWFDVTKSDWRSTMVEGITLGAVPQRLGMYWFDLRQQFGLPGVAAAVAGVWLSFRRDWRVGLLLLVLWVVNWGFAFTYNVGDTHVFFLPSHWVVALWAGCSAAWLVESSRLLFSRRAFRAVASAASLCILLAYPARRAYDDYPALDRSSDREPTNFFDRLTAGIDGNREIMGTDLNWQLHNGLEYYPVHSRPDLVVFDAPQALLYFPILVKDNEGLGRTVVLTEGAAQMVGELYGSAFSIEPDPRLPVPSLASQVAGLPKGTPYVLAVMDADPSVPVDRTDLEAASALLGLSREQVPGGQFAVAAGLVGEEPWVGVSRQQPFRLRRWIGGVDVEIRFESYLPFDTIRRAGFGHVIANRRHALTVDRGVSFVALEPSGRVLRKAWLGGLFTPQPRYLVKRAPAPQEW